MPDESANPRDESETGREASETPPMENNELASRLRDAADRATAAADAKPGPLAAAPHRALARTAENLAAAAEASVSDADPLGYMSMEDEPRVTGPVADGLAHGRYRAICPHENCPWWTSSDIEGLAHLHLQDHLLLIHADPTCVCGHVRSDHDIDDEGCDGADPDGDRCECERFEEQPRMTPALSHDHSEHFAPSPQGVIELALELDGLGHRFSSVSQLLSGLHDADALATKLAAANVSPTRTAEIIRECHGALKALADALASS